MSGCRRRAERKSGQALKLGEEEEDTGSGPFEIAVITAPRNSGVAESESCDLMFRNSGAACPHV